MVGREEEEEEEEEGAGRLREEGWRERMCLVRLEDWAKALGQKSQEKGFSPVWVRMWVVRAEESEKAWEQKSQEKGFSPVWVRMCFLRSLG